MAIDRISLIIQQMNEMKTKQNGIKDELDNSMQELTKVQKKIALLQQELLNAEMDYSFLDEQLRPEIAEYLKSEQVIIDYDRILA